MEEGKEILKIDNIQNRIFTIREKQVILDRDLSKLYGVDLSQMNRQVKRNIERFPEDFMFRLTQKEWTGLKCHFGIANSKGGDRGLPHVFTELGVSMLAGLLRSPTAIEANIRIIRAFVAMRKIIRGTELILDRVEKIEVRQNQTESLIDEILTRLESDTVISKQGIFFDGQIYDAYIFVADLIRKASRRVILIDNYIDDTVLTLLDKRADGVGAIIYTSKISQQLQLDIDRHNSQYPQIIVKTFSKAHDRFLIIDNHVYLVGASIKDLGKKWFGFTLMDNTVADELLLRLS